MEIAYAGGVTLAPGTDLVVLVSAGIGITPMAAMLQHIARTQPERAVVAAHADRTPSTHALAAEMAAAGARLRDCQQLAWYEESDGAPAGARQGLLDPEAIPLPSGARSYLCGPLPFLRDVRASLLRRGVPDERIHYEVFGPDLGAGTPVGR